MLLIQRKSDGKTLILAKNSAYLNGEDAQWNFDNNIKPYHPELSTIADCLVYTRHDIAQKTEADAIMYSGKRQITVDGNGVVTGCQTWPFAIISITGPMQLTLSNGGVCDNEINFDLVQRQINLVSDPNNAIVVEISLIKKDSDNSIAVWHRENESAMPAGYSLVWTFIKFTLPAGATDINTLGLRL